MSPEQEVYQKVDHYLKSFKKSELISRRELTNNCENIIKKYLPDSGYKVEIQTKWEIMGVWEKILYYIRKVFVIHIIDPKKLLLVDIGIIPPYQNTEKINVGIVLDE